VKNEGTRCCQSFDCKNGQVEKMVRVFINGKEYRYIEKLSISKLEHLKQLAEVQVNNYKLHKVCLIPYLQELENTVKQIDRVIKEKEDD